MSVRNRPAFYSTGNGYLDLLAAVQRRAVEDAIAGCQEAAEYLDATQPGWRRQALRFMDVSLERNPSLAARRVMLPSLEGAKNEGIANRGNPPESCLHRASVLRT